MAPKAGLTSQQTATKEFLVFDGFETMDTQQARQALPPNRLAWCENLQPIGKNYLFSCAGPNPALATIAGKQAQRLFYAFVLNTDYEIYCATDGSMFAVNIASGAQTTIAGPGTFSLPDVAVWQSQVLLIADPTAGYAAWNGQTLSKSGGVSPNLIVTAGGSGYTTPTVTISGGSGAGATATATVVAGVVTGLTLTNAGSGYKATDTLTVTINPVGGGAGATATAKVWPFFSITPTTLAVFSGRVWLGGGRTLTWTGVQGYDDAAAANASGSTIIPDSDLVHSITVLRALNNYLWIFGDNSIKQIGTVSVSGSTTIFAIVTLSSDTGTTFPLSVQSYNRLVLFANKAGVFAVLGSSVQKISDEMDGIFQRIDFTQAPVAALNDVNAIRCYMLLVRYVDPTLGATRSLLLVFQSKKWWVCSQGAALSAMSTAVIAGTLETFASSGADVTQIIQNVNTPVSILLRTALSHHGKPHMAKRIMQVATAQNSTTTGSMVMTVDTENGSQNANYNVAFPVTWTTAVGAIVTWVNQFAQAVTFSGTGFLFQRKPAAGTGIYLGLTLSGTFASGYAFNNAIIEYQDATVMASNTAN
jgi:hypothetical protein